MEKRSVQSTHRDTCLGRQNIRHGPKVHLTNMLFVFCCRNRRCYHSLSSYFLGVFRQINLAKRAPPFAPLLRPPSPIPSSYDSIHPVGSAARGADEGGATGPGAPPRRGGCFPRPGPPPTRRGGEGWGGGIRHCPIYGSYLNQNGVECRSRPGTYIWRSQAHFFRTPGPCIRLDPRGTVSELGNIRASTFTLPCMWM